MPPATWVERRRNVFMRTWREGESASRWGWLSLLCSGTERAARPAQIGAQERLWRYILTGSIARRRYNTAAPSSPLLPPLLSSLSPPSWIVKRGLHLAARMQCNNFHSIGKGLGCWWFVLVTEAGARFYCFLNKMEPEAETIKSLIEPLCIHVKCPIIGASRWGIKVTDQTSAVLYVACMCGLLGQDLFLNIFKRNLKKKKKKKKISHETTQLRADILNRFPS